MGGLPPFTATAADAVGGGRARGHDDLEGTGDLDVYEGGGGGYGRFLEVLKARGAVGGGMGDDAAPGLSVG